MPVVLQLDFHFEGPFGDAMSEAMKGLAQSIAQEPGLIWKVWTESAERQEAGGIYLFDTRENAQKYFDMHQARLKGFGVNEVNVKFFDVNVPLSEIDRARVQ